MGKLRFAGLFLIFVFSIVFTCCGDEKPPTLDGCSWRVHIANECGNVDARDGFPAAICTALDGEQFSDCLLDVGSPTAPRLVSCTKRCGGSF